MKKVISFFDYDLGQYVAAIVVLVVLTIGVNLFVNFGYTNKGISVSAEDVNSLNKVYVVKQFSLLNKKYNVYNEDKVLIGHIEGNIVGHAVVDSLTFRNIDGDVIASMDGLNKVSFPITPAKYYEGDYSSSVSGEMNWNMMRLGYNYDLTGNGFGIDSEYPKFFYSATFTVMGTQTHTINRQVNIQKIFEIKSISENNDMVKAIMMTAAANRMESSK